MEAAIAVLASKSTILGQLKGSWESRHGKQPLKCFHAVLFTLQNFPKKQPHTGLELTQR